MNFHKEYILRSQEDAVAWNDASLKDNITVPMGTMNLNRNPNRALNWQFVVIIYYVHTANVARCVH